MDGFRKGIALEKFRNIKQQTWMSVVVDFFFHRKCQCLHSFIPPTMEEFQIWSIDLFFVEIPDNLKRSTDFVIYSRYRSVFLFFINFEYLKFKLERQQQGLQIS